VHATHPSELPESASEARFHRIVFLTDQVPTASTPERLESRLREEVRNQDKPSEPYFSSFIPTLLVGDAPRPLRPRRTREVLGMGDSRPRFERDLRLLRIDPKKIRRHWETDQRGSSRPSVPFGVRLLKKNPAIRESMWRWARAVTNRQVGIAISGGGATSYRMVPLLEKLAEKGVPIDLVSGVSGGALIGAYFCKDGLAGLDQAVNNAGLFQLGTVASIFSTESVRWVVDRDLSSSRIGDIEVRLVALTTELHRGAAPKAVVVEEGTLGEAVRMSGSAPGLFAPTKMEDVRYADGGTASLVPARVLEDYGADLVFACNTIPGPLSRNPFEANPLGEFFYSRTPWGRIMDVWVTGAYLAQQTSFLEGSDADGFFNPEPQKRPLVETFLFYKAREIVRRSAEDPATEDAAASFADRWREFISGS
jgi:NTE family protein